MFFCLMFSLDTVRDYIFSHGSSMTANWSAYLNCDVNELFRSLGRILLSFYLRELNISLAKGNYNSGN